MAPDFKLRFDRSQIDHWASRYINGMKPKEKLLEARVEDEIAPAAKAQGHLTKADFRDACRWKSLRTQTRCAANEEEFVRVVSATALSTANERLRIGVLTLLDGVDWSTASVILHFCSTDRYPILDFRALWSLSVDVPQAYDFDFWWEYTRFSRQLAAESGVTMRKLDRALWQYSKEHQPPTLAKVQKAVAP